MHNLLLSPIHRVLILCLSLQVSLRAHVVEHLLWNWRITVLVPTSHAQHGCSIIRPVRHDVIVAVYVALALTVGAVSNLLNFLSCATQCDWELLALNFPHMVRSHPCSSNQSRTWTSSCPSAFSNASKAPRTTGNPPGSSCELPPHWSGQITIVPKPEWRALLKISLTKPPFPRNQSPFSQMMRKGCPITSETHNI